MGVKSKSMSWSSVVGLDGKSEVVSNEVVI